MGVWKMTHLGNLPSGEVFTYGFHVLDDGAATLSAMLTTAALGVTALTTTASGFQAYWNTTLAWHAIVVDEVDPSTGAVIASAQEAVTHTGNTAAANPLPPGVAVCVTLRTATVSRRGRGRFYLPAPAANALDGSGNLLAAAQTALKTSVTAMWNALEGAAEPAHPAVLSRLAATTYPATSYDIGNVFDSMRSRRNKLVESRIGASV